MARMRALLHSPTLYRSLPLTIFSHHAPCEVARSRHFRRNPDQRPGPEARHNHPTVCRDVHGRVVAHCRSSERSLQRRPCRQCGWPSKHPMPCESPSPRRGASLCSILPANTPRPPSARPTATGRPPASASSRPALLDVVPPGVLSVLIPPQAAAAGRQVDVPEHELLVAMAGLNLDAHSYTRAAFSSNLFLRPCRITRPTRDAHVSSFIAKMA